MDNIHFADSNEKYSFDVMSIWSYTHEMRDSTALFCELRDITEKRTIQTCKNIPLHISMQTSKSHIYIIHATNWNQAILYAQSQILTVYDDVMLWQSASSYVSIHLCRTNRRLKEMPICAYIFNKKTYVHNWVRSTFIYANINIIINANIPNKFHYANLKSHLTFNRSCDD